MITPTITHTQPYMDGEGSQDGEGESEPLFSCRIDNAKV